MANPNHEPLPPGDYVTERVKIGPDTVTLRITEGAYAGRLIFMPTRMLIPNQSNVTVENEE